MSGEPDMDFGEVMAEGIMTTFESLALRPTDSAETRRRLRLAHLAGMWLAVVMVRREGTFLTDDRLLSLVNALARRIEQAKEG